ncbi:MAG: histidine phosphatase family protein [Acetobacteraceae bacterium]
MPGVGLSEAGREQAERLAAALASRPIAAVVSSPLQRAQETAAPIAARLGLAVTTDPGLDEIDFGGWTGLEFSALDGRPEWDAWNRARSMAACPGGESMVAAQARALACVAQVRAIYPEQEVVLVSHQDVLKALLAHYLGVPLDLFHRISLDPAHRSVVVLSALDARVDGVNLP